MGDASMRAEGQHRPAASRCVPLPVLGSGPSRARPRSSMGRWRAAVLVGVHAVFAVHIAHWLLAGSTISPVEPSESARTMVFGELNAGLVFFVLAIVSTLVFGRFFCGWGCHVVALQDLCSWMMRRAGVQPKPFRSRLLAWAPLVLGLYMFVWPMAKREAIFPALDTLGVARPAWLRPVEAFEGFHAEFVVRDFWATFPPWYVAIPFFGVVGFAAVYFLGSKGFCTYGCPYGGVFGVADSISPGRIVVSPSCEGCGHCTAVCTSNVRVHEEVRDFGMVVDPGCMKCMDCVSACPKEALSFGFATPPLWARPRHAPARERRRAIAKNPKRFDLSWPEELAAAGVFIALLLAFRGMLDEVPMLMAVGMAGVGVLLIWKLWSMLIRGSVRLQHAQLKLKGRWTAAGGLTVFAAALTVAAALWSGAANLDRWRAGLSASALHEPVAALLRPDYVPAAQTREHAGEVVRLLSRSSGIREGGRGWTLDADDRHRLAFALLILGRLDDSIAQLRLVVDHGQPTDALVLQVGSLMQAAGRPQAEITELYERVLSRRPGMHAVRAAVARLRLLGGMPPGELPSVWSSVTQDASADVEALLTAAESFASAGRPDLMQEPLGLVAAKPLLTPAQRVRRAELQIAVRELESARAELTSLAELEVIEPNVGRRVVMGLLALDEVAAAMQAGERWTRASSDSPGLWEASGAAALAAGDWHAAQTRYGRVVALASGSPWELAAAGEAILRTGLAARRRAIAEIGLGAMQKAAGPEQSPTLLHDYGRALLACRRYDEGLDALRRAAAAAPQSRALNNALAEAERARQGP